MAEVTEELQICDNSLCNQTGLKGHPLSTGKILYACPRNVFTISRGDDDDGYEDTDLVHFGQRVRICTSPFLTDKTMYLYVEVPPEDSGEGTEGEGLSQEGARVKMTAEAARWEEDESERRVLGGTGNP